MTEPLCKDCKHYSYIGINCVRGKRQTGVDPVHGYPVYSYKVSCYAGSERESIFPWRCGPKGRYFESI